MSLIFVILYPALLSALTAESLPGPGPLTRTSNVFNPKAEAFWPAFSAAICAAKGVLFLDPLNPDPPDVAHAKVLPCLSVMVTIVLLNDALMLEEVGCFSVLLEKIPNALSKKVSSKLTVPIIGIGAGSDVDGQVLVLQDMLGMNKDFSPRFLRRYLDMNTLICEAVKKYSNDIKSGNFPNKEEQY